VSSVDLTSALLVPMIVIPVRRWRAELYVPAASHSSYQRVTFTSNLTRAASRRADADVAADEAVPKWLNCC